MESQKRITVDETLVDLPKYVELGKARSIREMTVYKGEQVICLKEVSEKCLEEIQLTEDLSCVLYESYDKLSANLISKIEDYMFSNIETICKCGRWHELIVKRPDFLCKIVKAALLRKPEKA